MCAVVGVGCGGDCDPAQYSGAYRATFTFRNGTCGNVEPLGTLFLSGASGLTTAPPGCNVVPPSNIGQPKTCDYGFMLYCGSRSYGLELKMGDATMTGAAVVSDSSNGCNGSYYVSLEPS